MDRLASPACSDLAAQRGMNLKTLWTLIKDTFAQWNEDNPFQLAAALAYSTLFSMAPLLMIAIAVAGLVFGREASQNQVIGIIDDLVGVQGRARSRHLFMTVQYWTAIPADSAYLL